MFFSSVQDRKGCYRQGDVFIVPISALPKAGLHPHRPVLAEGEATGHAHRLADPGSAQVFSQAGRLFLSVRAEHAEVVHDEHAPVRIPRGQYEVRIQREYHPREIRQVVD